MQDIMHYPNEQRLGQTDCSDAIIRFGIWQPLLDRKENPPFMIKECSQTAEVQGAWINSYIPEWLNITQKNCTASATAITPDWEKARPFLNQMWNLNQGLPNLLPNDMYYLCGRKAYKWLPYGGYGNCTLVKLVPDINIIEHSDLQDYVAGKESTNTNIPNRFKREVNEEQEGKARKLIFTPWYNRMGIDSLFGTRNYRLIESMADLIDNITDIYDSTFKYVAEELKMAKREVMQHRLVLDFLTAQSGGYCLTLQSQYGIQCCTYFTNETNDPEEIIKNNLKKVVELKDAFRKMHNNPEPQGWSWGGWDFSWLNPLTWFKSAGGWIAGILMLMVKGALIIFLIYIGLKLGWWLLRGIYRKIKAISSNNDEYVNMTFKKCSVCNLQTPARSRKCVYCASPIRDIYKGQTADTRI